MFIPLYQLAKIRYEDRLDQRRAAAEAKRQTQERSFERIQSLAVAIGMALLPLGESIRRPVSEPRSLDISTQ